MAALLGLGCDGDGGGLGSEERLVWARSLGGPGDDAPDALEGRGVGTDLGLAHDGPLELGDARFPATSAAPGLIVVALGADGEATPRLALGGPSDPEPGGPAAELWSSTLARDELGNRYVGGFLAGGPLTLPSGPTLPPTGGTGFDAFIAKRGPDGRLAWADRYGGAASVELKRLVTTSGGRVWAVGDYRGAFDLGGASVPAADGFDGFAARLSPTGGALDVVTAAGPGDTRVTAAAATPDGGLILAGVFDQRVSLGARTATAAGAASWAARVDAAGAVAWLRAWAWAEGRRPIAAAAASEDRVLVGGPFAGTLVDAGERQPAQGSGVWILELSRDGERRRLRIFDGEGADDLDVLVLGPAGPAGRAWAGGGFELELSFGDRILSARPGRAAGWIARFDGELEAEVAFAVEGGAVAHLVPQADGGVVAAGAFTGSLDLGSVSLESAGGADAFVLRLAGRSSR